MRWVEQSPHCIGLTLHRHLWGVCVRTCSCSPWMADVHVRVDPALFSSSFLSSLICLADLGNVSGGRSRGRSLSLSASPGRCGATCSLTRPLRSGGGTLGSKLGILVGLRLRTVGGLVLDGWASPSTSVSLCFRHLTRLRDEVLLCTSVVPILARCKGSIGKGGRRGGG